MMPPMRGSLSYLLLLPAALCFACSGGDGDDDDIVERDAGTTEDRDGGVAGRDGGDGTDRDAGTRDGGERDAGPRDSGAIDPAMEPFRTIRNNGTPESRIDIVIIGDGYTLDELNTVYDDHVDAAVNRTLRSRSVINDATQPFRRYRDFFNVHRIHLASNESGIDDANGDVDTALDGRAGPCGGLGGPACPVDFVKVRMAIDTALAGSGIVPDIEVVILNGDADSGAGGYVVPEGEFAVVYGGSGNPQFDTSEAMLRGIAMSWGGLASEEVGSGQFTGMDPLGVNTSTSPNGSWPEWMGYTQGNLNDDGEAALNPIGVYEGAGGFATGLYRPSNDSKLGTYSPGPFNAVSREALILRFYDFVSPIESHDDNSMLLVDPQALFVQVVDMDNYDIRWSVDGQNIPEVEDSLAFGPVAYGVPPGMHTVTASVTDNTNWVRRNRDKLVDSVTWQISISP